ncbi:MAG: lytic transglycosylase domain-containing protein [Deltaproteobacteria bacterium]|nr:lytic transglycosylase domain-containing protein [Deltaproteobacteria bacterium]MBI4796163.1 lytic transglycosylase domain-containing protein [Deltaproteobacteria bacterium]
MRMKISLLAVTLLLLALNGASASSPGVSDDGSLVLDTKESPTKINSGDTLHDIQTLGNEVQAYIFHNRTRVWSPNYVYRARKSAWNPLPNPQLERLISKYSQQYRVDPSLIRAVMRHESGYNSQAVSPKGAQGLMQLMPGTAALMGVQDPFDPEQNIAGGVGYLRRCLDRFQHNVPLAVAAYNAGPEAVAKYHTIPPYSETQSFVQNVLGTYQASGAAPAASAAAASGKGKPKAKAAQAPSRPKGPKIIEVRPRKKSQPRVAQNTAE